MYNYKNYIDGIIYKHTNKINKKIHLNLSTIVNNYSHKETCGEFKWRYKDDR